jgi:hypothetical protein
MTTEVTESIRKGENDEIVDRSDIQE